MVRLLWRRVAATAMTKAAIAVWTGAVGTLLFAALFVAAAVRLRVHMRRRAGHTPVFRRCHAVIVVFAALDIPRYLVTLIREEPVEFQSGLLARVVYAAHLCSTWLQVVALTMIILMWATVFHGACVRASCARAAVRHVRAAGTHAARRACRQGPKHEQQWRAQRGCAVSVHDPRRVYVHERRVAGGDDRGSGAPGGG